MDTRLLLGRLLSCQWGRGPRASGTYPPAIGGPILKVPFPLHPDRPVALQVPEIELPFTVPVRVRTLFVPPGNVVVMVIPNTPITLPLEFPLRLNEPVSEYWFAEYDSKQGPGNVKLKLVTVSALPLPWVNVVEKV
jgi:hypothetical protein